MVTSSRAWFFVPFATALLGCSGGTGSAPTLDPQPPPSASTPPATAIPPGTVEPGGTGPTYPGTGFRVHEWGTNTVVVGSDGSMQRGLHHEEEDLPSFVYDRRREDVAKEVDVKMETPVTYFYSDKPLTAKVAVRFPQGILTQWFPSVVAFFPPTFKGRGDPALDRNYSFSNAECKAQYGAIQNGELDWGQVEILPRGDKPSLLDAPLDRFTWSHAREVDANALRVKAATNQDERFLFYRGLGNFPIGVKVTTAEDGKLTLKNQDPAAKVGAVFVLRVEKEKAAFEVVPAGIAASGSLDKVAPPATQPIAAYAQDLAIAMVAELDKAGLYHDESVAMVKTWARQWFRTPGIRVLYLAPEAWTNAQIPLEVTPKPMETVRVMVIRVEALTPADETVDVAAAQKLDNAGAKADGEAHFASLGRFAEPRLRRAISKMGNAPLGATQLLDKIAGADVSARAGE